MLTTTSARIQYAGAAPVVAFSFPYYFLANTHLNVILTTAGGVDVPQTLGVDFTATGALVPAGGTITMTVAPAAGTTLTIYREAPLTQLVDYVANDNFPAETHEMALDKLTMEVQQLADAGARALLLPVTEPTSTSTEIPNIAERAKKILGFDSAGAIATLDLTVIPITTGSLVFSLSSPTGTDIAKSVTITIIGATQNQLIEAWLVDATNTEPVLTKSLDVPDQSNVVEWHTVSSTSGVAVITVAHSVGVKQWKLVVNVLGVLKLSNAIVLGV